VHRLRVDPKVKPVKEHLRRSAVQKRKAIGEEVARLLAAEFIREIYHSEWLANVVMVPKKDDSLRMCIDFKHINRACPKDHFPLPRIDQIVDSTAGCERLSFLDANSGYHQIRLYGPDEIKNSFHHPIWVLLLCHHAIRLEERGSHIHEDDLEVFTHSNQSECGSIHG
jgi:hypothetical protein